MHASMVFLRCGLGVTLAALWLGSPLGLRAQQYSDDLLDPNPSPRVLPVLPAPFWGNVALPSPPRQPPVHFFLMQPGFLYAPLGLDDDDDTPDTSSTPAYLDPDADLTARFQVSLGNLNPFFDFQSADNPGKFGYYQLHAQYQVVNDVNKSLCLGLQAFTPAGLESEGLAHGPTVFRPSLSWWQDVGDGVGLNGFVCKSVLSDPRLFDRIERGYRCGLALAQPLTDTQPVLPGTVHFFMEALANYQPTTFTGQRPPSWEVLPGLHWQLHENCWVSGAIVLPVGPARNDDCLWQLTCWWKF